MELCFKSFQTKRCEGKMAIIVRLDRMLADRKMSVGELAERLGLDPSNVSRIKTGKVKAMRFSTLDGICKILECFPGDILDRIPDEEAIQLFGDEYLEDTP